MAGFEGFRSRNFVLKDKKETTAKNRERLLEEGAEESKTSQRQTEKRLFKPILAQKSLKLVEISADGDCMYNAIAHQLSLNGLDVKNPFGFFNYNENFIRFYSAIAKS